MTEYSFIHIYIAKFTSTKHMNTFLKTPTIHQSDVSFCIPILTIYNYTFTLLNVNKCQQ